MTLTRELYNRIYDYMMNCMGDAAHDAQHVQRVLHTALDIAGREKGARYEILVPACLLHDIGRATQYETGENHAKAGAKMAMPFLLELGYSGDDAALVCGAIRSHRFRGKHPPATLEAKILYDADKLDVAGLLGVARTIQYQGKVGDALYTVDGAGRPLDGRQEGEAPSFNREYCIKLEKIYDKFYTKRGRRLAKKRRRAARAFYKTLQIEINSGFKDGESRLQRLLTAGQ